MPDKKKHMDWASHNEELSEKLREPKFMGYLDWIVIVYFYTALHYIDAYLASDWSLKSVSSHTERENFIVASKQDLEPVISKYFHLKDDSVEARYEARQFSKEEVDELRQDYLDPLIKHMHTLLHKN